MKLPKFNIKGQSISEIEVSDSVFNVAVNRSLIHDLIKQENNNLRQGNASTKGRSDVSGGGIKPWKQKGTGRARQGSIRATQWVGGGVPFGSKPRSFKSKMPQKMRQSAYRNILSLKANEGKFKVIDQLLITEPKTKLMAEVIRNFNINEKVLFIVANEDRNFKLAARNLPNVKYLHVTRLSGRDLFYNKLVIGTEEAVRQLEKIYQ